MKFCQKWLREKIFIFITLSDTCTCSYDYTTDYIYMYMYYLHVFALQVVSTAQEAVTSTLKPANSSAAKPPLRSPSPIKSTKHFPFALKPGVDPYAEERKLTNK